MQPTKILNRLKERAFHCQFFGGVTRVGLLNKNHRKGNLITSEGFNL